MNFRHKIKNQLHGFTYLMEVLDLIVSDKSQLNDDDVRLTCEILKTLFNVTLTVDRNCLDEVSVAAVRGFALKLLFGLKLLSQSLIVRLCGFGLVKCKICVGALLVSLHRKKRLTVSAWSVFYMICFSQRQRPKT